MRRLILSVVSLAATLTIFATAASAQSRIALVIANSAYQSAPPLKTTNADANLVAATLTAAGYDVTEVSDLTKENFGAAFVPLLDKIKAAGPDAVVFVYFSGYGVQYNGDSYLIPVDAQINKPDNVGTQAMPLSTIINALAPLPAAARIIVLDAARDGGFGRASGRPLPPGLALVGVPPGFLVAYSAAPGTVNCSCSAVDDTNSPFASALATLMRQPGLDIEQVLNGVRLEVNQASKGAQTPWMVSALNFEVKLFNASEGHASRTLASAFGASDIAVPPAEPRRLTKARFRRMSPDEAYNVAIEIDSLKVYQWFVELYPRYYLAGQIWHIIDMRRQAILWHRALVLDSTFAYWNYLDRYPNGIYAHEARLWLDENSEPPPPPDYVPEEVDLPPGYYDEAVGLEEVVPEGYAAPPRVFGDLQPIFVLAPHSWRQPVNLTINISITPPAPPPLVANPPVLKPKPTTVQRAQPVPSFVTLRTTRAQRQQKAAKLQAWRQRMQKKNKELAHRYKLKVATAPNPNRLLGGPQQQGLKIRHAKRLPHPASTNKQGPRISKIPHEPNRHVGQKRPHEVKRTMSPALKKRTTQVRRRPAGLTIPGAKTPAKQGRIAGAHVSKSQKGRHAGKRAAVRPALEQRATREKRKATGLAIRGAKGPTKPNRHVIAHMSPRQNTKPEIKHRPLPNSEKKAKAQQRQKPPGQYKQTEQGRARATQVQRENMLRRKQAQEKQRLQQQRLMQQRQSQQRQQLQRQRLMQQRQTQQRQQLQRRRVMQQRQAQRQRSIQQRQVRPKQRQAVHQPQCPRGFRVEKGRCVR